MPVFVERRRGVAPGPTKARRAPDCGAPVSPQIEIGLVNNMPDAALQSTERQILSLLRAGSDGRNVRVRLWSLPGLPRSEYGQKRIAENYEPFSSLFTSRLDALIVSGSEPRQPDLRKEPYWDAFVRLHDWAKRNTVSTLWSCLAAHAAVFHADGLERRLLSNKVFGLFACEAVADHPLLSGLPNTIDIPHSRWNAVEEHELRAAGYTILTRSEEIGADMFLKQDESLFLFMQGHPEYESQSLMLEYRRDVGRWLAGERETYPDLPERYFDDSVVRALLKFRQLAQTNRDEALLTAFPIEEAAERLSNRWHAHAERIFANWLSLIGEGGSDRIDELRWSRDSTK